MALDVHKIVEAGIQQEILKAIQDAPEYINNLVEAALNQEVNEFGSKPEYGQQKIPYLEYIVGNQIRIFAGKSVKQWLEDNEEEIREMIIKRIKENDIGEKFADAVSKQMKDNWGIHVEFFKRRD